MPHCFPVLSLHRCCNMQAFMLMLFPICLYFVVHVENLALGFVVAVVHGYKVWHLSSLTLWGEMERGKNYVAAIIFLD